MSQPDQLVAPLHLIDTSPDPEGLADERADAGPATLSAVDVDVAFLVGPARSGTTALYKALCLHPRAAWISNWTARYPRALPVAGLNRFTGTVPAWRSRAWFGPDANAYVYGRPRAILDRIFPTPVEGEPVYAACGVTRPGTDGATAPDAGVRLRAAFGRIRRFSGGDILVSKRIANNLRIPMLAEAFPRARFVQLVRDGRAVADSLSRVDWWDTSHVWWYGGTPSAWAAAGGDPWELCARNWVEELREIRAGLASVPPRRALQLRYEDLVADPLPILERVARFVGLGRDERWLGSIGGMWSGDRNDGWRRRLGEQEIDRITAIQREELEALGYLG